MPKNETVRLGDGEAVDRGVSCARVIFIQCTGVSMSESEHGMTAQPASVVLSEMTWPEAEVALNAARVAIIPVGSTEQHGPGMTLATDIRMAEVVAERVASALAPRAVVAPPLPYGLSPHHMRFPGTITLTSATFGAVLREVMSSLQQHGINRFFLLNGHGGNQAALSVIATETSRELGVEVATALYLAGAYDEVNKHFGRTYAHACEIEVSVALAAAPELVRREALQTGEEVEAAYRHTALSGGGAPAGAFVTTAAPFEQLTRNGNLGEPQNGSAEIGEEIVGLAVRRIIEFLEDFTAETTRPMQASQTHIRE